MGKIIKISGPLIVADGMRDVKMYDVVRVSEKGLIGEVIELRGDKASIQVYEETSMLGTGEPVVSTEQPLSVELGPGLIGSIYDGIQRPLESLYSLSGARIDRGVGAPALDRGKKWEFAPAVEKGDAVESGDILGTVKENEVVEHRIMVPFGVSGKVEKISAGAVKLCGSAERIGSVTAIGAVSPPGGDMSEPVSQATLRIVKVFWGLSSALAYKRHFPAIDWLVSYSLYSDRLSDWFARNVDEKFTAYRAEISRILQDEARLDEIVRLVGIDALSPRDRLTMEAAKSVREDYLHQNSFHEVDTYTSLAKQFKMLKLIVDFYHRALRALDDGAGVNAILALPCREQIGRAKYVKEDEIDSLDKLHDEMLKQLSELKKEDE